jgi:hypothetical protein
MNEFWFTFIMLVLALGLNGYLDTLVVSRVLPEVRLARSWPPCLKRADTFKRAELAVNLVWFYQRVIGGAHVLILISLWESRSFWRMLLVGVFLGLNMLLARRACRHRSEIEL